MHRIGTAKTGWKKSPLVCLLPDQSLSELCFRSDRKQQESDESLSKESEFKYWESSLGIYSVLVKHTLVRYRLNVASLPCGQRQHFSQRAPVTGNSGSSARVTPVVTDRSVRRRRTTDNRNNERPGKTRDIKTETTATKPHRQTDRRLASPPPRRAAPVGTKNPCGRCRFFDRYRFTIGKSSRVERFLAFRHIFTGSASVAAETTTSI